MTRSSFVSCGLVMRALGHERRALGSSPEFLPPGISSAYAFRADYGRTALSRNEDRAAEYMEVDALRLT